MKELLELFQNYGATSVFILFILFLSAGFGVMETVKRLKGYFDSYHAARNAEEDKDRSINERLERLENDEQKDKVKLNEISTSIQDLKLLIAQVQENQNKSNVAMCRSSMYRLASELINKQWMSQVESDTLEDLLSVYTTAGNSTTPSVVKRALMLPVLTDEEIRYKKEKESQIQKELQQEFQPKQTDSGE